MAERGSNRWLRPVIVLPVLGVLLLAAMIFSPRGETTSALDTRLTTYSTNPFGARGAYEVFDRLGWRVARWRLPFRAPLDSSATYFVQEPAIEPSETEVSVLLDAVRRGATMVVSPPSGTALADSLGLRRSRIDQHYDVVLGDGDSTSARVTPLERAAAKAPAFARILVPLRTSATDTAPVFPPSATTLLRVNATDDTSATAPAIMTLRLGKGIVVALGDFEFLRNENVRDTSGMVLAVRLLEAAGSNPGSRLVFDEYHQGFGPTTTLTGVISDALFDTPTGRAAVQVLVAGLALLLALGIRPIAPRERRTIERRSPLEHVGALTLAYEQIHATRLASGRLVRGLRRRHPLGAGALTDDAYLSMLGERVSRTSGDVAILKRALAEQVSAAEWVRVAAAIDNIEGAMTP